MHRNEESWSGGGAVEVCRARHSMETESALPTYWHCARSAEVESGGARG